MTPIIGRCVLTCRSLRGRQPLVTSRRRPRPGTIIYAEPSARAKRRSSSSPRQGRRNFFTLSFSGAGHLLPYHLGVVRTLLSSSSSSSSSTTGTQNEAPLGLFRVPIEAVSGSSSGAIAATVTALLPHRLDEYADRFLQDRGHAFRNLREMLLSEDEETQSSSVNPLPALSISTTRCSDGSCHLFAFRKSPRGPEELEYLLKTIEASCRIPQSFHLIDMVVPNYNNVVQRFLFSESSSGSNHGQHTYPEIEGVEINGNSFVDGAIVAPYPPTLLDGNSDCIGRIVVSPIAGEYFYRNHPNDNSSPLPPLYAIRPRDGSKKIPFLGSVTLSGNYRTTTSSSRAGHESSSSLEAPVVATRARPSMQNLRAMITALGVVPGTPPSSDDRELAPGGVLREWYERGQEDAHEVISGILREQK